MKYKLVCCFVLLCSIIHYSTSADGKGDPKDVTCSLKTIHFQLISIECYIYLESQMDVVITPDLITANQSTYNSSIFHEHCTENNTAQLITCDYSFNRKKTGAGEHQFSITVSANVSETNTISLKSNTIDIVLWDDIQYVVCLEPEEDPDYDEIYTVSCLTPLPTGLVNCSLNLKTNNTFVRSYASSQRQEYFPDQNILKTFALECQFSFFLSDFLPGHHEFQGNFSTVTSDGNVSFKTSNWTSWILGYQSQMNFTVNESPEGAIVKLNDSLLFHCSSENTMSSIIKLQQGNLQFPFMYTKEVAVFHGTELRFPVTSCQQAGLYYCSSYGKLMGDTLRNNVSVNIVCPQRLRSKYFQPGDEQFVGIFDNTNTVEIPVIGYPSPITMTLMKQQEPTKTSIDDGVFITYKVDSVSPYGNIFVIFSNERIISKMTNFTLTVNNGIEGDTLFEFSIRAAPNTATSLGIQYGVLSLILCIILLQ